MGDVVCVCLVIDPVAAAAEEADGVIGGVCPEEGCAVLDQEITEEVVGSFPGPAGGVVSVDVVMDHCGTQSRGISWGEYKPPEEAGDAGSVTGKTCRDRQISAG